MSPLQHSASQDSSPGWWPMAGDAPTAWRRQPSSRDVSGVGKTDKTYWVDKSICERLVFPPKYSHTLNSSMCYALKPCGGTGFGGGAAWGNLPVGELAVEPGKAAAGAVVHFPGGQLEDQESSVGESTARVAGLAAGRRRALPAIPGCCSQERRDGSLVGGRMQLEDSNTCLGAPMGWCRSLEPQAATFHAPSTC